MPRYELMYILASSVSDDLVPETAKQIEQFVTDFGGTEMTHAQLGKKKLAYPIKKTRNGHYGVINFASEPAKVNELDAKIRTQGNTIIRHIIINIDEHLERMEKDRVAQAKMNRNRPVSQIPEEEKEAAAALGNTGEAPQTPATAPVEKPAKAPATVKEATTETPIEVTEITKTTEKTEAAEVTTEQQPTPKSKEATISNIDEEIEKALSEDITK